jgi:hypothetical protein
MSNFKLLDNGFDFKDKPTPPYPVFYEFYDDINELQTRLETESETKSMYRKQ